MYRSLLGVLTLCALVVVGCDEAPTSVSTPEFNKNGVTDDDMSEYTLLVEVPGDLPIEYGFPLPCLGEGLYGYDGGVYQLWRKTIRTPAGGQVAVEKLVQPEFGSYYNDQGDRWQTTRAQARINRITRPGDGHTILREAFNEWLVNESTGQRGKLTVVFQVERDENGDAVSQIMKFANCS